MASIDCGTGGQSSDDGLSHNGDNPERVTRPFLDATPCGWRDSHFSDGQILRLRLLEGTGHGSGADVLS